MLEKPWALNQGRHVNNCSSKIYFSQLFLFTILTILIVNVQIRSLKDHKPQPGGASGRHGCGIYQDLKPSEEKCYFYFYVTKKNNLTAKSKRQIKVKVKVKGRIKHKCHSSSRSGRVDGDQHNNESEQPNGKKISNFLRSIKPNIGEISSNV
jgi:hypothetical protein